MDANLMLLIAGGTMVAAGVYLLMDKVLTRILLGTMVLGNGLNLLMLHAGGPAGSPPIIGRDTLKYGERIADPLAQAMILTAIVISMALTAFMLAMIYRHYRYRTADVIETDAEDMAIAIAARSQDTSDDKTEDEDSPAPSMESRPKTVTESFFSRGGSGSAAAGSGAAGAEKKGGEDD